MSSFTNASKLYDWKYFLKARSPHSCVTHSHSSCHTNTQCTACSMSRGIKICWLFLCKCFSLNQYENLQRNWKAKLKNLRAKTLPEVSLYARFQWFHKGARQELPKTTDGLENAGRICHPSCQWQPSHLASTGMPDYDGAGKGCQHVMSAKK